MNDMRVGYNPDLQLDRINNDGDYTPGNCRWVTVSQNCRNTRRSTHITIDGKTKTLSDWIDEIAVVKPSTVKQRFYVYGWNIKDALTKPPERVRV